MGKAIANVIKEYAERRKEIIKEIQEAKAKLDRLER